MIKTFKLSAFVLAAFASTALISQAHAGLSLNELQGKSYAKEQTSLLVDELGGKSNLRLKAMRDAAISTGAQHGFLNRMERLKKEILGIDQYLDRTFDFSTVMKLSTDSSFELHVLPPIIREAKDVTIMSDSAQRKTISNDFYEIIKPARLVSIAPNWRQYLVYANGAEITEPHNALLPKTKEEQELWSEWVSKGWKAGEEQAEREMIHRIRKLRTDFLGMLTYTQLVEEGLVDKPVIVSSTEDVVGGGREMSINQQIIQLAVPASLNPNNKNWIPLGTDNREGLTYDGDNPDYESVYFN